MNNDLHSVSVERADRLCDVSDTVGGGLQIESREGSGPATYGDESESLRCGHMQ
jgi:hypothetical protein